MFHAPLVAATPGLEVAAITTSNPERAERARREHPGAEVLADPAAALERADDLDFAVVATPNDSHVPLARAALDAGLAVVVDKPLAPSADEARALVEHARKAGRPLTVFLNRRWDSDQLTLRRLLDEEKLGRVLRYESMFERWRPELAPQGVWREQQSPEAGGGLLLDIGPHLVDQAIAPVRGADRRLRRGRASPRRRRGRRRLRRPAPRRRRPQPPLDVRRGGRAGPTAARLGRPRRRSSSRASTDRRTGSRPGSARARRRMGRRAAWRAGAASWTADSAEPVPSEPGDWPAFYAGFERCPAEGGPPPVEPGDAVAGLEVLDAARASASRAAR